MKLERSCVTSIYSYSFIALYLHHQIIQYRCKELFQDFVSALVITFSNAELSGGNNFELIDFVLDMEKKSLLWKMYYHLSKHAVKLAFLACYSYLYLLMEKKSRFFSIALKWNNMAKFTVFIQSLIETTYNIQV